jgi:tetratricopeptide (TPR) repeat protein
VACALALIVGISAAYVPSFHAPFLFDDEGSVTGNPSLAHLGGALSPPSGTTVSGRPVLNLSFALTAAAFGPAPAGFHAVNLAVLVLSSLLLLGVARRTAQHLKLPRPLLTAFFIAALWSAHPLLTESVTYIVQRAESLMGLFFLATLYCFIRGAGIGTRDSPAWLALACAACLLGMGTKEVMVAAPLVVYLYDRTFLSRGFGAAIGRRPWFYAGLAATWAALAAFVASAHGRGGTAGFSSGQPWWRYAAAQPAAVLHYLRLAVWPAGLVFDYGSQPPPLDLWGALAAAVVAVLVIASVRGVLRGTTAGFLGACFFAVLAPSSSFVPIATEFMAEHRMFLPLAVVASALIPLGFRWLGGLAVPVFSVAAAAFLVLTWQRNETYRSAEAIWADAAARRPGNARAQDNLGFALFKEEGRGRDAITHYRQALRLQPDYAEAHYDLAYALVAQPGGLAEAIENFEAALKLRPGMPEAHYNLARALEHVPGRQSEAEWHYAEAARLRPGFAEAHYNLGCLLLTEPGRAAQAASQFEEAVRLTPDDAGAHYNLGRSLDLLPGHAGDARIQYEDAIRLRPGYAEAHLGLGSEPGADPASAERELREAVRLKPDLIQARLALGYLLESSGRLSQAAEQYRLAIRADDSVSAAHFNLGNVLGRMGSSSAAVPEFAEAVRLDPSNVAARCNLGNALSAEGRQGEAFVQYESAISLRPDDPTIRINYAVILLDSPGNEAKAAEQLNAALRIAPANAQARRMLAALGASAPANR